MSLTATEYSRQRKRESLFYHRLEGLRPISKQALDWMGANGKDYRMETIHRFQLQQGFLRRFAKGTGPESQRLVSFGPCIVISVGPIYRCYSYLWPKEERWCVVPAGYGAQWLGDLFHPEPIICEGEWDFLRLQDYGIENVVTHTAGAGTWFFKWTALFKDKRVWVCYDRDPKGQHGMAKVAKDIFPVAREVRLVDLPLPGTSEANDISDYFRLGGTVDEFRKLLERARLYAPKIYR